MHAILRRIEAGERCWSAECALRGLGAVLLGVCAAALSWLHRAVTAAHGSASLELAAAGIGAATLAFGLAFALEGPGLFRLLPLPGQHLALLPGQGI